MKKTLIGFAVSALFAMGSAHAAGTDTSATLNITGTVTAATVSCAVNLPISTVSLQEDMTNLINQGNTATHGEEVMVQVQGTGCSDLVANNHIAYKFVGTQDTAAGTALANSDTTPGAATGVGIGIFSKQGAVININDTQLAGTEGSFKLQMVKLNGQQAVAGTISGALTIQIERI